VKSLFIHLCPEASPQSGGCGTAELQKKTKQNKNTKNYSFIGLMSQNTEFDTSRVPKNLGKK